MSPSALKDIWGKHQIADLEGMAVLAGSVASQLQRGDALLLFGDLGSGKTAFVQALAGALQVESRVVSPTFTVAAEYDIPSSHIANQLVHVDLYRLGGKGEEIPAEDMAHMQDMFASARQLRRIVVVEWADLLGDKVPQQAWQLHFAYGEKENERIVEILKK